MLLKSIQQSSKAFICCVLALLNVEFVNLLNSSKILPLAN